MDDNKDNTPNIHSDINDKKEVRELSGPLVSLTDLQFIFDELPRKVETAIIEMSEGIRVNKKVEPPPAMIESAAASRAHNKGIASHACMLIELETAQWLINTRVFALKGGQ